MEWLTTKIRPRPRPKWAKPSRRNSRTPPSVYGGAFAGSFKALQEYQSKLLHLVQENTTANMQFAQKLMQPRWPSDFVEFLSTHLRERATAITDQAKELAAIGQEAAKKAAESLTPPQRAEKTPLPMARLPGPWGAGKSASVRIAPPPLLR